MLNVARTALLARPVAFSLKESTSRAKPFQYGLCTRTYVKKAKQVELTEADSDLVDIDALENDMQASLNALKWEFTHTVTPRLSPAVVGNLRVSLQGQSMAVKDLGQITMPNSQTLLINLSAQPKTVQDVVKVLQAKVNLNPMIEGSVIKAPLPKPSKEYREELVKVAKAHAVKSKVSARRVREKAISTMRKKKSISKDSIRRIEDKIQSITDKHSATVDQMVKAKTDELSRG